VKRKKAPQIECPSCGGRKFTRHHDWYRHKDARPLFKCMKCSHHWTAGKTGGRYIGKEQHDGTFISPVGQGKWRVTWPCAKCGSQLKAEFRLFDSAEMFEALTRDPGKGKEAITGCNECGTPFAPNEDLLAEVKAVEYIEQCRRAGMLERLKEAHRKKKNIELKKTA